MLAFSFIRSLNNITSAEKAKYLHFQQHELFARAPFASTIIKHKLQICFCIWRRGFFNWKTFSWRLRPTRSFLFLDQVFFMFSPWDPFPEDLDFCFCFIYLCCYGMEWLLWRRLSLFFLDRGSWKINEVFKVFQIPLDLNLEAGTQTRKSNLLQIVFLLCLFFVVFKQFATKFCSIVHIYAIAQCLQCLHGQEKASAFKKQFWASGLAKLFQQQNKIKERISEKLCNSQL